MALASYALPFGLRQVKLVPLDPSTGAELTASTVFLPASRTFSFSESEDFENLEGDDRRVASHGAGPVVEWDLEGGGISLEVWAVLSGATINTSGSTPNAVKTLTKLVASARPAFNVYGRAISDSGGDFQMVVYNCKADGSLEASMENGSFLLTSCSGNGVGQNTGNAGADKLYDFIHRETAAPFDPAPQPVAPTVLLVDSPAPSVAEDGTEVEIEIDQLDGIPTPTLSWSYSVDSGADTPTTATLDTGMTYIVTVPENDNSYTTLTITVTATNSEGTDTDTVSVTVE